MKEVLILKFTQNKECRNLLLSTGDSILEEASPYDMFWGTGKNKKGENHLGKLLMETREFLMEEDEPNPKKHKKE